MRRTRQNWFPVAIILGLSVHSATARSQGQIQLPRLPDQSAILPQVTVVDVAPSLLAQLQDVETKIKTVKAELDTLTQSEQTLSSRIRSDIPTHIRSFYEQRLSKTTQNKAALQTSLNSLDRSAITMLTEIYKNQEARVSESVLALTGRVIALLPCQPAEGRTGEIECTMPSAASSPATTAVSNRVDAVQDRIRDASHTAMDRTEEARRRATEALERVRIVIRRGQ